MSRALAFLKSREPDRPFFLNVSFARPHSPYVPPQPYLDRYINADIPAPAIGAWAAMHDRPAEAVNPNAWRGRMSPRQIRRARAAYYGSISFIDTQIGRLSNWMRRFAPETWANTWVIFTSDHGDMQGDHNLWRKTYAYEASSRIPLIVAPPPAARLAVRSVAEEVVGLQDVMPTVLEATGLQVPATVEGGSLLPLLSSPASDWRPYLHGEHCTCYAEEQEMQYVTDGRRKFIWLPRIGVEQFFDLEQDPSECEDLAHAPERQDEIARWRGCLVQELSARDCGWVREGALHCPEGEPLVSPYLETRWRGASGVQSQRGRVDVAPGGAEG
jgi:arylsulfatase A-like enzyme